MEKDFLESANKFYEFHSKNYIRKANKYAKKMHMILKKIMCEDNNKVFIDNILSSDNNIAIIWVCNICIDYDYRTEEVIGILKKLSLSNDEIISRDAKMLLYVKCN